MPSCGPCGKGFASGGCAGIHSARWGGSCSQSFVNYCPECPVNFNPKNRRRTHMNETHSGAQCSACSKPFYDKQRCAQHEQNKVHTPESTEHRSLLKKPDVNKDHTPRSKGHSSPPTKPDVNKDHTARSTEHSSPPTKPDVNKVHTPRSTGHSSPPTKPDANKDHTPRSTEHSSPPTKPGANKDHTPRSTEHSSPPTKPDANKDHTPRSTGHSSPPTKPDANKNHTPQSTKHSSPPTKPDANNDHTGRSTEHRSPPTKPDENKDHTPISTDHSSPPTKPDVNKMARQFHDNHARQPDWKNDKAFKTYHEVSNVLCQKLKEKDLVDRIDYVGSTYERTAVTKSSDFDVLFVKRDKQVQVDSERRAPAGFAVLQKGDSKFTAEKERNNFKGELQKVFNNTSFPDYDMKLRQHGPAIQVDVLCKTSGQKLTSIDVVPAKELSDGTMYVAKAPKSIDLDKAQRDELWHKSSSVAAKEKLMTADRGNGCRKEAYRNCKIIRDRENNLLHITSFQIKSTLFKNMDEKPDPSYWTRDKLGERTVDVWKTLVTDYRDGRLRNYFHQEINLIENAAPDAIQNTANRIEKMVEKPDLMFADLQN